MRLSVRSLKTHGHHSVWALVRVRTTVQLEARDLWSPRAHYYVNRIVRKCRLSVRGFRGGFIVPPFDLCLVVSVATVRPGPLSAAILALIYVISTSFCFIFSYFFLLAIYNQKEKLKTKSATIKCFFRFSIARIWSKFKKIC
jgi:hypothetical protein